MSSRKKAPKKGFRPRIEDEELVSKNRSTNVADAWAASVAVEEKPSSLAQVLPLLVNEETAAGMLDISARKLWDLEKAGYVRTKRIGRLKRYLVSSLREYAEGQGEAS
jgi:hypothetical protein